MKNLLPIFLLFFCLNLSAQDSSYVSMISDSSAWFYGTRCCGSESPSEWNCNNYHYKLFIGGDSTYQGTQYKKINYWWGTWDAQSHSAYYVPNPNLIHPIGLIREDSNKVFIRYFIQPYFSASPSDTELVVYDFNLTIGDTFNLPLQYNNIFYDSISKFKVIAKDSVNTSLGYRKTITLKQIYPEDIGYVDFDLINGVSGGAIIWIQGIGSNKGLIYNLDAEVSQPELLACTTNYLCYKWNNEYIYGTGICDFIAGVEEQVNPQPIDVFPNPAENFVTIKLPISESKATLQIINMQGQLVKIVALTGNEYQSIETNDLPNGIYQLMVNAKGKIIDREKLVVVR